MKRTSRDSTGGVLSDSQSITGRNLSEGDRKVSGEKSEKNA